ncbi:MAG: hypothetical protein KG003_12275 [Bacteroidetes bacterium]|nr:hypothetical protein [Bacteroidota bacterium]
MQNDISNKIRLLLNELAILNQPELIQGKYFFNVETLMRLKQLSAELYLSADMAMDGHVEVKNSNPLPLEIHEKELQDLQENMEEPVAMEPVVEIPEVTEVVVPVVEERIVKEEPEMKPVEPVVEMPVPVAPVHENPAALSHSSGNANVFEGKLSLTRRFEYVNGLFGGDANAFTAFINEISLAGNLDVALQLFQKHYEEKNWKRKSETADDLKQLIRKVK